MYSTCSYAASGTGYQTAGCSYAAQSRYSMEIETEKRYTATSFSAEQSAVLQPQYAFSPDTFLLPDRALTQFVGNAAEIKEHIKDAFRLTTGRELPAGILINICSREEFKQAHEANMGIWSEQIAGFAINRNGKGLNEVFARQDYFDRLMLTIGHEIGHLLSPTLCNQKDEEAKAFAFSLEWIKAVAENNIGGLKKAVSPMPAENNLHNVAFEFVLDELKKSGSAMDVFDSLVNGNVSTDKKLELIILN